MCLCNDRCLPVTEEAGPIADMSYTLELAFQCNRAQSPRRYLLLLPPRRAEVRREGRCHTLHSPGELIKCPMSSPLQQGLALYLVGLITHPSLSSSPVLHYSRIEIGQITYSIERSGRELHEKNRVIIIPGMQLICTRAACTTMACIYIYTQGRYPSGQVTRMFYSLLCRRLTVGSAAGERTP